MSLAFEDDKILTSNPFIDLLLYNLKVLSFNTIIKDQYSADSKETLESLKNSDLFLACYEKHAEVALFPYIPHDILVKAGVPENQIQLYENNDEYDPFYLPKEYHEAILKLAQPWFVDQYVEMNEYYRMIVGLPPLGDPGVPMRDYEYLLPDDLLDYTGEFVHETGTAYCQMLDNMGILDIIKADFPDAKYLDYVTKGLDIYTVRRKMDFQILYYPTTCDIAVTQEFLLKYEENRKYMIAAVYSKAMELESEYYHSFMIIYLVITVMLDMLMEVQSHIVKKDILDRRCIQYIFSIYGIPYYRVIPYKYQERMCKNVWSLVKYKSCTQEMLNIIDLFGFDDIHIFKYYLLKVRKTNAWGEYEYNETTKLVCRYNDIIEHTTLEENMSSPSTKPPIPPNLDWYEKNGNITTFTRDRTSNLYSFDDEENVISSTIEALDNSDLNDEYDNQNNQFISTRAAGDTVRYINYPFDYFLQKGNVMFVKLDGRVLVEGVDYTISNYNTITFHNNIANGKSKVTYEFYYDKETVDQDFKIDLDHAINMDVKQFKKCKKGQILDLNPVKWNSYFPNENEVIVSVSSVWLPPALYNIDTENYTLTIDPSVSIQDRVVTVILLYSKALHTQFEKHNVTAVQDGQTDFFIPEPFQHYCLNENKFFITMGSVYVNQDRYTITASTQKNQSKISFIDGTRVERGRNLTFNFLYSTNAIWSPITLKTKTIHIVATEYYQSVFNIDFPVENYGDCRYKVYIKLLGWYLSETMFEIVGNTIVFMDQSIALQPGDEMDIILAYVDTDRSKGDTNIMVSTDYRVADQDKQSVYDITFPTDHYHTKGNLLLVDVEGIYLTEGKDYTVNYNDADGGRNGTVTLLTYDYKPMKGQRVNYTFYWDYEAEYYAMIDQQQIPIERKGQNTFTLAFPFFPYIQTGNSYIVMSGSTIVTPDRISWVDQFNIKIDGLDPEEPGGYITVLYIYNNYYIMDHEEDLIVEWIDAPVLSDQPYVEVPVPFENYIENDWPYFVTYGDRQWLSEDKYEVYDSSWYTDPVTDKGKYGSSITFTFIYLKREPWIVEITEEDYKKDMDLYFSKIPLEDLYSTQYMKDPTNWKCYESITLQDGWWDGLYYKQNNHEQVIEDIYHEKWNYARSKYYGIFREMDIVKYSSMISYFYSMLYDDVFLEEELKILIPSLSPYHKFRLADLFIYMTCLTYIFNEMEDFVLDQPDKIMMVQGFNFKASMTALKKYLRYHHEEQKKFDIWDFIIPTEQIPDLEEFMNILNTNWDVRQNLIQEMIDSEDYREYHIWKHIYDALMVWKLNFKFFTLENGKVATTYTEFLKEKDSVLYNSLQEIKAMGNYEEQQDYIVQIVDDIVYVLDEFINGEWKYVFDRFPGQSPDDALKYILLVISFFKSYKIVFLSKGLQIEIGGNGKPDEDSFMKGMDLCRIRKTDNIVTYYPIVEAFQTTKHFNIKEVFTDCSCDSWMREDFTLIVHSKNQIIKDIESSLYLESIPFSNNILDGKLQLVPTEFSKDIIESETKVDKQEFEYNLFSNNIISFDYNKENSNTDIDSDIEINKELFNKDILSNNEFTYEKEYINYDLDSLLDLVVSIPDENDTNYIIDSNLNVSKLYPTEDELDKYTINTKLLYEKEEIEPNKNNTIDGTVNIDKEYVSLDDTNYMIEGTVEAKTYPIDFDDDSLYIIEGTVNIDKLYPTEEELESNYTINSEIEYIELFINSDIDSDLDVGKLYPTEEELDKYYTINSNMNYEIMISNSDIDSDLNIDKEFISEDILDRDYTINSNMNYEIMISNSDIDSDLDVGKLYPTEEELESNYTINSIMNYEIMISNSDIDSDLNVDKLYPTEDELESNYTITSEIEYKELFINSDIDSNLNINKEFISEDILDRDYTINSEIEYGKSIINSDIDSDLNIDKLYPTEDELDKYYTIDSKLLYEKSIINSDIDSDLNIDKEYVSEDILDRDYTILGNVDYIRSIINSDIDSDLNIDKLYPTEDELESNYTINSELEYEGTIINSDIDSDLNIDKLYPTEDELESNYTINSELEYEGTIINSDIDSNLNIDKLYPTEEELENHTINTELLYEKEEIEPNKNNTIDGTVNIDKEFISEDILDKDYSINGDLNINKEIYNIDIDSDLNVDKLYPTEEELDEDYTINGEVSCNNIPIDFNDPRYNIDGIVNVDKEELTEEELNDHYTITGDLNIDKSEVDIDDNNYIISGKLDNNENILILDIDSELDIEMNNNNSDIDSDLNIFNQIYYTDIDSDLNINKEYVSEDILDKDYTITGELNIDKSEVNIDDNYIINSDLNVDKEYISEDILDKDYTITGEVEIDNSVVDMDGYSIDGNITLIPYSVDPTDNNYIIDSKFDLVFTEVDPTDNNYIISGNVDIDGTEIDNGYSIDGTVNINKEFISEDILDRDCTITGELNIDKEELTEEELNDHYTITGDLNVDKSEIDINDNNYIISGNVTPDLIPVDPDEGYEIDSTLNMNRIYINNFIESNTNIENNKVDDTSDNYNIASNLEILKEEYHKDIDSNVNIGINQVTTDININFNVNKLDYNEDIDSDVNINNNILNKDILINFTINKLQLDKDINSELNIDENIYESDIINGDLNIDKEFTNEDIDSELNINNNRIDKDIDGILNINKESIYEDLDIVFNIDKLPYEEDIDADLNIDKEYFNTDINGSTEPEEDSDQAEIEGNVSIGEEEFTTDINGSLVVSSSEDDTDLDGSLVVNKKDFSTDIDCTLDYIVAKYIKQNVLKGYEFINPNSGGGVQLNSDLITGDLRLLMYRYQLGFYGHPCDLSEDDGWFDAANANNYYIESETPDEWTLTFNSASDAQPDTMYESYTYYTQPLRLIEPIENDRFYMEIDIIDDNIDLFNQNIENDDWDDKYTLDICIGEFDTGDINGFKQINSISNGIEVYIGRMGVGNAYIGSSYTLARDSGDLQIDIDNIDDFRFNDNPTSDNIKYTIGIGITEDYYSIFSDSSGTWKEYPSRTNKNIQLSQIDNSRIGIVLYSDTMDTNEIKEYLDHLKVVVRFKNFVHQDSADSILNHSRG